MSRRWPTVREVFPDGDEGRNPELQESYEKNFFRSIRLRNGVYKTTYANRFDDLNALSRKHLPPERPLRLMDVAVSSGVSTWEWIRSLEGAGIAHTLVAGDLTVDARLIAFSKGFRLLTERDGYPLLFEVFGLGIPSSILILWRAPHLIPTHLLCWLWYALGGWRTRAPMTSAEGGARRETSGGFPTTETARLLSPRLLGCRNVEIVEDDLTQPGDPRFVQEFHVIRAANILQRGYFTDDALSRMVANLRARLRSGGLLIVCRTERDGMNRGTIFRLNDSGAFGVAARLPEASEIERLVLDLTAHP